jgi:hypothetical protein
MDYIIDYSGTGVATTFPHFIYRDMRICSKMYVLIKTFGFVVYTITLTSCVTPYFYSIMNVVMFLSAANSARYEYQHYKRYGTTFSSIDEYHIWKRQLWPKTLLFFSIIELGIKIGFFVKTFPPQFEFTTMCAIGESIFKIHMLLVFSLYAITSVFSTYVYCSLYSHSYNIYFLNINAIQQPSIQQTEIISLPVAVVLFPNEECCICMDIDNIQPWIILPCYHKFHKTCISTWIERHNTCPICRLNIHRI